MRLPRNETQEREAWLQKLFAAEPKLSVRKAQEKLVKEFGRQMRPARILVLRRKALTANQKAR